MVFNSLTFMLFFAIVVAVYRLPIGWSGRKLHLLLASYLFYAAWNPPFVILLWISTLVDWWAARALSAGGSLQRRSYVVISLLVNLGMLAFFKYAGLALETFQAILAPFGVDYRPPALGIVLPVGISFYTFQTLSYTLDVYRGTLKPAKSFLDFALYVSFFPQLVAGPIVRAAEFLPQLAVEVRLSARNLGIGSTLLVAGLFEKVVLADTVFAPIVDTVYADPAGAGFVDAWVGTLAFAGQILCDFSGYSTCAIGAALCLGFSLPRNFHHPYAAVGFADFWRRWHISLSSWLRDYLYISLGGNRRSRRRTLINLMLVMLLGGLWHGAAWHFVLWGGIHGSLLVVERVIRARSDSLAWARGPSARFIAMLGTFVMVCLAWVPFRAEHLGDALDLLRAMLLGSSGNLTLGREAAGLAMGTLAVLLLAQWFFRDRSIERCWSRVPLVVRSLLLAAAMISIIFAPGDDRAFIYFQF